MKLEVWSKEEFLGRLREVGAQGYHHLHPFSVRMNAGKLDKNAIRLWVANRFYYQCNIPRKDAAILANCPLREVRRRWIRRVTDHDGREGQEGGIEQWIRLGIACGLTREAMMDEHQVRPGVRFAVDAYVNFARTQPWPIAIASSLTELFAPELMAKRLKALHKHYTWVATLGSRWRRIFRAPLPSAHRLISPRNCPAPPHNRGRSLLPALPCRSLQRRADSGFWSDPSCAAGSN
jgi:pyrroloquinoline-quinone synthase